MAIKEIPTFGQDYEPFYETALIEIVALMRTRSDYVIDLIGVDYIDGLFYICLDLAVSDLNIFKGNINREQMERMSKCVKYIHELGLIHKDIKPDNFLLTRDNRIVLSDMGSCIPYPDTRPYTVSGTNNYMDPEMLKYQIDMIGLLGKPRGHKVTARAQAALRSR
jgi:serine/threonine protein kinase